jgi:hypothetical protein
MGDAAPHARRLAEARRAHEVGDHVAVRRAAETLERVDDPAVREAAAALEAKTRLDPAHAVVLALSALSLLGLVLAFLL